MSRDLVTVDFGSANPENNFRIVSGSGTIEADEMLVDELFNIRVKDAVKLWRVVEVLEYVDVKPSLKEMCCNDDEPKEKKRGLH